MLSFMVDLAEVLPGLEAAGGTDVRRATLKNGVAVATLRDPDGILVELLDVPSRAADVTVDGPLAGLRILEVGHILAGPFATMLLADLGADVIKIESETGDLSRDVGSQYVDGHNVYFASINRNKRSVRIDLATDGRPGAAARLVRTADALLVNLRPSAIRKLGLDYASLREVNPKIVCVALTGYGLDGPEAEWPAFDYVVQAGIGLAAMTGDPDGPPMLPGLLRGRQLLGDHGRARPAREGPRGRRAARSTSRCSTTMLSQLNYKAAAYLNGGVGPDRGSRPAAHNFYVPAQLFATADGYLALFVTHDEFWRRLCAEIGEPEWGTDPRFATMHARYENRDELVALLTERLARRARSSGRRGCDRSALRSVQSSDSMRRSTASTSRAAAWSSTIPTGEGPLRDGGQPDPLRRRR